MQPDNIETCSRYVPLKCRLCSLKHNHNRYRAAPSKFASHDQQVALFPFLISFGSYSASMEKLFSEVILKKTYTTLKNLHCLGKTGNFFQCIGWFLQFYTRDDQSSTNHGINDFGTEMYIFQIDKKLDPVAGIILN